jgi:hypothetical protein
VTATVVLAKFASGSPRHHHDGGSGSPIIRALAIHVGARLSRA